MSKARRFNTSRKSLTLKPSVPRKLRGLQGLTVAGGPLPSLGQLRRTEKGFALKGGAK